MGDNLIGSPLERSSVTRPLAGAIHADDVEASDSSSMQRLGRYIVLGLLGRGGMGVVYSGYDEQLRRRVALKKIHRRGTDDQTRRRLLREAQAMARLTHPNIVAVYEAFEVDAQLCIAMEFVAGRTLREWVADDRPPQEERLAALIQAGRGIAAAHAAGLVHRDLKPDNIMLGDDGRVRIMDFGLARTVDEHPERLEFEIHRQNLRDMSGWTCSNTSTFVGTPGYAAPEQHLGLAADSRSDVFSFCVLVFEALHGRRPFAAHDVSTILDKSAGVEDSSVPAWLDAVVRRGLAVEPDARWPTMDALLDALAEDPLAKRRRRLHALGLLSFACVLVAAAIHIVLQWREASQRARREETATARLRAVEATIARTEAMGDHASAEAAFRTFIADPEHQHTRALTQAWLARGDRRRSDPTAARHAFAEAYVHASTIEDEREVLRRFTELLAGAWDGTGLGRSVGLLRARGVDSPALAGLAFDAALWRRDLGAAVTELARPGHPDAEWAPLLTHLSRATSLPLELAELQLVPGPGPARIAVRDSGNQVVLLGADLAQVGRWRDDARFDLVRGTSWVLTQTEREARIVDVLTGQVLARGTPRIGSIAPFDATGDGVPEIFFGRSWPDFGFERWDGIGRPDARMRPAHVGTDASQSTFNAHTVGDLDGDGRSELAIGFGPWQRFDLRVYRPDARGELELVAERKLGRIGGLAHVQRGSRRLLAVLVDDSAPSPEHFPEPPHTGGPPGAHFFEWRQGTLEEVDFVALPDPREFGPYEVRGVKAVGDFDGDGREDLAFTISQKGAPWLHLLRQTEGGFEPLLVGGLWLFAAAQLDDDAPLELLAARAPDGKFIALGLGDEAAPRLSQETPEPPTPTSVLADPWLVDRWSRADDLTSFGLLDAAAASLRDAALLVTDRSAKSVLLDRAGELFAHQDLLAEVLALDCDIHDDPEVRNRARVRRAQALSRLGRGEEALAEAEAVLQAPAGDSASKGVASEIAREQRALLEPGAQIDVRFDAPLAREWQIHTPGALRRNPTSSTLGLVIPSTPGLVAELPIDWGGGPLALEFELDVERIEFGAGIELSIAGADGQPWLGGAIIGQGGGGWLQHVVSYKVANAPWVHHSEDRVGSALHTRRLHLRITYFPERGDVDLMVVNDGEITLRRTRIGVAPTPGPQRLLVDSYFSIQSSLAVGDLRRLIVRGARLGATSPDDVARNLPARILAEHELRAALEALSGADASHPHAEALRLLVLGELGELADVAVAAEAVLPHVDDPSWRGDLALLLRRQPIARAALRGAAGPALLPALAAVWEFALAHRNDPLMRGELLDGLNDLERLEPRTDGERRALHSLLSIRSLLWQHDGEPLRAAQDGELAAALVDEAH